MSSDGFNEAACLRRVRGRDEIELTPEQRAPLRKSAVDFMLDFLFFAQGALVFAFHVRSVVL